jgi:hypothetical protein
MLFTMGRESFMAYISLISIRFLAIHAKGGESISPKQKDHTTTKLIFLVFQFVFKEVLQKVSIWYLVF